LGCPRGRTRARRLPKQFGTRSPRRDEVTKRGVEIKNAKIVGDVDLAFAKLDRPIQITNSRFEGAISLRYARAESVVDLGGSLTIGKLDATSFHSERDLILVGMTISEAALSLDLAAITGLVAMNGMTCSGELRAGSLQVGGDLLMRNKASFQKGLCAALR
jgi:hypothetical protein